ncbi:MAG: CAP domain-containing protein [Sphingomonadaceae bacterium]
MATPASPGRPCGALLLAAASTLLIGGTGKLSNLEERLLAAHNRERASLGVPALEWDPALEDSARQWGRHLAANVGDIVHYSDDPYEADPEGENLFLGTKGHFDAEAMVGAWIDEKRHYRAGVFPDNSRTGDYADVGHYTQLMWRDTERIGCAVVKDARYDYLVCRYKTAGNVFGERPF